ncbi:MAG: molecular chaperone GrpE [Candidatus Sumerlaeota bacterium]|nr:molecular chaperone GrpE [Candidatus Sumerlaeota bacterium]
MGPFWKSDREAAEKAASPPVPAVESDEAAETTELADKVLRLAAELENVRKRARRDVEVSRRRERAEVLVAFLEVLDNFDRAMAAQGAVENDWSEGIEGIYKQFTTVFARLGVRPLVALGEPFDPELHEAVAMAEVPDTAEGIVVEVTQKGYTLEDGEVLRPARVVVSR